MLAKFLEPWNLFRILTIHVPVWFFAGLGMLLTGKYEAGWLIWKGLLYHINPVNFKDTLQRRKLTQQLRTKSDAELFKTILRQPNIMFYIKRFFHYIKTGRHG